MESIQANRVYEVLQEDLGPKDSPLALLCMVLVSMFLSSALVLGAMVMVGVPFSPPILVGSVVGSWVLGYGLGMLFGQDEGINDSLPHEAGAERGDGVGCGCLMAIAQFAFGGLYSGVNALFFGNSALPRRRARLASALITMLYNEPDCLSLEEISQSLQAARLPTRPKTLQKTLQFLISKNYLFGNPEQGYRRNPSQIDHFQ